MRRIDLHDVGYGECVVLCGDRDGILMVDCGSSNRKLGEDGPGFYEYVENGIVPRYRSAESRAFLLTHCHRDHLCGLWHILSASPAYFGRIFLPVPPNGEGGRPFLLEFALFVFAFLSRLTGYGQVNTAVLELFSRAAELAGPQAVFPVRQGSAFSLDGAEYEAVWPPEDGFCYPESLCSAVLELERMLSVSALPPCALEFLQLRERFCAAYLDCCASSPVRAEETEEIKALLGRVSALIPELLLLPCAGEAAALLSAPKTQEAYSHALNASCVVFQNRRTKAPGPDDILMTGDVTPESLQAASPLLYDGYAVVKAPHHGTASAFSPLLEEIAADHILISNGAYQGGNPISERYASLAGMRHCAGRGACAWFRENGSCCNRLCRCSAPPGGPALAVRCSSAVSPGAAAFPCGIRTVSWRGEGACLCDIRENGKNFGAL